MIHYVDLQISSFSLMDSFKPRAHAQVSDQLLHSKYRTIRAIYGLGPRTSLTDHLDILTRVEGFQRRTCLPLILLAMATRSSVDPAIYFHKVSTVPPYRPS